MLLSQALEPTNRAAAESESLHFFVQFVRTSRQWNDYGWSIYDLIVSDDKQPVGDIGRVSGTTGDIAKIERTIEEWYPDLKELDWQPVETEFLATIRSEKKEGGSIREGRRFDSLNVLLDGDQRELRTIERGK